MGETADQLRQEIDGKRGDAAHKIDEIEQRMSETVTRVQDGVQQTTDQVKATVQETIHGAQEAVGQTAQQVTETVKNTTQQVTEQVKANMDWRQQVEERPLVMVGAAFLGGFVLGSVTGGEEDRDVGRYRVDRSHDRSGFGVGYGASYGGPLYSSAGADAGQTERSAPRSYEPPRASGGGAESAMAGGGLMAGLRGLLYQSGLQDNLMNSATALVSSFNDKIRTTLEEQVPGFKEQMQKKAQQQAGQAGSDGSPGRSGQAGGAGSFGQAGGTGIDAEAATTDASGRTSTYFGGQESRSGSGANLP